MVRHLPVAAFLRRRVQAFFMASLLVVTLVPVQAPATVEASTTEASRIVAQAKTHLGAPYRWGAIGPYSFDCSGFVYHAFKAIGLVSRIGGRRTTVGGYYRYFRALGRVSRSNPRVGDLVVYGYPGYMSHMGIYLGNGYTISALTRGITIHRTMSITTPFIAYLHVSLTR